LAGRLISDDLRVLVESGFVFGVNSGLLHSNVIITSEPKVTKHKYIQSVIRKTSVPRISQLLDNCVCTNAGNIGKNASPWNPFKNNVLDASIICITSTEALGG